MISWVRWPGASLNYVANARLRQVASPGRGPRSRRTSQKNFPVPGTMERGIHEGAGIAEQSREGTVSQPIEAGAVIGGRYQVTDLVMTSADGDEVLQGIDQVLNRPVSVLVGSSANSEQLSLSAREIATGERYAAVQVLDLGITEGRSYLVTNLAESADLLDLVIQSDAPYVEPFYTDTLGTEIFGVTRSKEPVTYEDDAEYYEDLHSQEDSRPAVLGKLPEINLGDKFSGLKDRFGRAKSAPSPAAPVVPPTNGGFHHRTSACGVLACFISRGTGRSARSAGGKGHAL